jgi:hypothetical protein
MRLENGIRTGGGDEDAGQDPAELGMPATDPAVADQEAELRARIAQLERAISQLSGEFASHAGRGETRDVPRGPTPAMPGSSLRSRPRQTREATPLGDDGLNGAARRPAERPPISQPPPPVAATPARPEPAPPQTPSVPVVEPVAPVAPDPSEVPQREAAFAPRTEQRPRSTPPPLPDQAVDRIQSILAAAEDAAAEDAAARDAAAEDAAAKLRASAELDASLIIKAAEGSATQMAAAISAAKAEIQTTLEELIDTLERTARTLLPDHSGTPARAAEGFEFDDESLDDGDA